MLEDNLFSTESTVADLAKKFRLAKDRNMHAEANSNISITVLANFSTQYLVNALYASLVYKNISPDIYESPFNQWEFELNNTESETNKRKSDFTILLLSSTRLLLDRRAMDTKAFVRHLDKLLTHYKEKSSGKVVMVLPESVREGFDQTSVFFNWVKELRLELQETLGEKCCIIDIHPLIMEFGFEKWHSPKFLINSKFCCHPNCYPLYGRYLADFVQSSIVRPVKLIITDLDNMLWRGVVGDLGWENVGLDQDADGYPYLMLQRYLQGLRESGVLLATCSKNSLEVAKQVFENRREMILKFNDFVAHEINWNPKSQNIRNILDNLNLTQTGILFLDDSKFEREEVRSNLTDLIIPELPENPERWCEFLSKSGMFNIGTISQEDINKSEMYFAEKRRKEDAAEYTDYSSFLKNLQLTVQPEKVSLNNIDRVFELIHKTNQFNLTDRRLGFVELKELIRDENNYCYCHRLRDKYSDYGIISVFIAEKLPDSWKINTWLMSCRAMGRGVENAVFEHFLCSGLILGETIYGEYIKTDKNKPISDLLDIMGFSRNPQDSSYIFTLGKDTNPKTDYIEINED